MNVNERAKAWAWLRLANAEPMFQILYAVLDAAQKNGDKKVFTRQEMIQLLQSRDAPSAVQGAPIATVVGSQSALKPQPEPELGLEPVELNGEQPSPTRSSSISSPRLQRLADVNTSTSSKIEELRKKMQSPRECVIHPPRLLRSVRSSCADSEGCSCSCALAFARPHGTAAAH